MILVDASIWIDHLRAPVQRLSGLLADEQILSHPFVIGEIALGHIRNRGIVLAELAELPRASAAMDSEVLALIELHGLHGVGIGYVDAHLLASVVLTPDAGLWTRDRGLAAAADRLGVNRG